MDQLPGPQVFPVRYDPDCELYPALTQLYTMGTYRRKFFRSGALKKIPRAEPEVWIRFPNDKITVCYEIGLIILFFFVPESYLPTGTVALEILF